MNGCRHEHEDRQCHHPEVVKEEGYIDWCAEGPGCPKQEPETDRMAEIKARTAAATPGPLKHQHGNYGETIFDKSGNVVCFPYSYADGSFIAAAYDDVPYLLGEIDRLKMMIDAAAAGQETMQKAWATLVALLTAERDAAVADLVMIEHCGTCKREKECQLGTCDTGCYEWRGARK